MDNKELLKTILISLIAVIFLTIATIVTLKIIKNVREDKIVEPKQEEKSLYSKKATEVLKELNLTDKVKGEEYSKTLETMLESNIFNSKYIEDYKKIEYTSIPNFEENINKLLDNNYKSSEINYILSNFKENLDILLNMKHIDILDFKNITNFDINKLERYLTYNDKNEYDLKTVVTYVNIGLDKPGYSDYSSYTIEEAQNDLTILVNKYHKLPDNYEPNDLVELSYKNGYAYHLRKEAATNFEKLTSQALLDNVIFYPFSAYRSFNTQSILYNRYKARDGALKADTYSARPGFSEHQLGLAVDVRSHTLNDNLTDQDYKWMLNNSYKYGFIIRYPKGKQHITQFIEEPWHLRYLGVELATKVHHSNLTYDEYYDLYMNKDDN